MQDLSPADPISWLVPTGQQAPGPLHSSREAAMTAPGSVPAMAEGNPEQPGPHVEDRAHEAPNIVHGDRPVTRIIPGTWNNLP